MEERKKPTRPFSVIYADAKQALTRQVGNTMAAYGLPIFMAEIRTNAGNELADDTARYEEELKEYYEAQIKEKEEAFEKEKAELIRTFEEPAVLEETEEPEMTGTEEAPSEAPVIIETKEIVEETEVD